MYGMSYDDYLSQADREDSKEAWIDWKFECCGMNYVEAMRAANDPDWGYEG